MPTSFLVQNDAGSQAGANAYVSVANFKAYHADRGNTLPVGTADATIELMIVRATDYMDSRFNFVGTRCSILQRTAWPRSSALDSEDNLRSGVPVEVVEACCDYALIATITPTVDLNPAPDRDPTGQVVLSKRSVVGPIQEQTDYSAGGNWRFPKYPKADSKLSPLLQFGGGIETARS